MPWRKGQSPVSAARDYEDYLFEQWSHGIFDDFWKRLGIYAEGYYERYAEVPIVHFSGWYDPYARTATENYVGLKREKRASMRLILGPWTHGDRSLSYAGDVDFGPTAPIDGNLAEDFFALRLAWYDRWLKNGSPGAKAEPAVQVFVMGGGGGAAIRPEGSITAAAGAPQRIGRCRRPGGRNSTCSLIAASPALCPRRMLDLSHTPSTRTSRCRPLEGR
jgi:putative CocE/NonD family hydrolase